MDEASVFQETEPTSDSEQSRQRLAAWVQFPRRIALLLLAFGAALGLIVGLRGVLWTGGDALPREMELDWSLSLATRRPVAEIIAERLSNTLTLVGAALFLAALLATISILVALLVHLLERRAGPLGSILKGLGRILVFAGAAPPAFCVAMFFMYVFALQMDLLPVFGMLDPAGTGSLGELLKHLILPSLTLALLPAALTAQAVTRAVTLPRSAENAGCRLWLQGLFKGLGVLLGQAGGLLGVGILVETVFAWPGIGRVTITAAMQQDFPLLLGCLNAYAGLVLGGRLTAELFRWLERLVRVPPLSPPPDPTPWRKTARRVGLILGLLLLVAPLGLAAWGLTTPADAAVMTDVSATNQPPSPEHSWGTDRLGRDAQARVLRGCLLTLATAAGVAVLTTLLGGTGGAVTGLLAARRTAWSESLADLLLFPADVLLLLPAPALALTLMPALPPQRTSTAVGLVIAAVLLPRCVRFYQSLWIDAPRQHENLKLGAAGLGALFLGSLFGGLSLVAALDFLGLGVPPPAPALAGLLYEGMMMLRMNPTPVIAAGSVLWVCAFALYTAADALIGAFHTKDAMSRLNE